jgi:hypothetical protein
MRARDNPFAVQRVLAVRYRLGGLTWEALLERLAALGLRAAIVGPEGSGKTTLLEDLGARLVAGFCGVSGNGFQLRCATLSRGARRLPPAEERDLLAGLSRRDILLVDGADELGRLAWRRLCRGSRAAGGLLVTSHRPGLLPTLFECATTPALLEGIVRDLLGPEASLAPVSAAQLFARHRGNLRDALRALYDLYAGRPAPSTGGSSRDVPGAPEAPEGATLACARI